MAPSVHNTQPWLFQPHGLDIDVYADRTRHLVGDVRQHRGRAGRGDRHGKFWPCRPKRRQRRPRRSLSRVRCSRLRKYRHDGIADRIVRRRHGFHGADDGRLWRAWSGLPGTVRLAGHTIGIGSRVEYPVHARSAGRLVIPGVAFLTIAGERGAAPRQPWR
jgi:hypothetical protein